PASDIVNLNWLCLSQRPRHPVIHAGPLFSGCLAELGASQHICSPATWGTSTLRYTPAHTYRFASEALTTCQALFNAPSAQCSSAWRGGSQSPFCGVGVYLFCFVEDDELVFDSWFGEEGLGGGESADTSPGAH
ncbi:hypothetical protein XENOCAPTIV_021885, partial [Xenoophorus captivus]